MDFTLGQSEPEKTEQTEQTKKTVKTDKPKAPKKPKEPKEAKPAPTPPASDELVRVNLSLTKDQHKAVRFYAVEFDCTLTDAMRDLIAAGLKAKGSKA